MVWPARIRRGAAAVAAVTLVGCGAGTGLSVQLADDAGIGSRRALPLIGTYYGSLDNAAGGVQLTFHLDRDGIANGALARPGLGTLGALTGRLDSQRILRLDGAGYLVEGWFEGAYNPNRPSQYVSSGVRYLATWRDGASGLGSATAWYEDWPPPAYDSPSWSSFTVWPIYDSPGSGYTNDPGSSGGTTTDSGSSPSPGFESPVIDTPPDDNGGDPLTDEFVLRHRP